MAELKHCVYAHVNTLNDKVYIGYSSQPERRWRLTRDAALRKKDEQYNQPFYKAIRKYGWNKFTHTILEEFSDKRDALEAEKFWIEFFRANRTKYGPSCGYNLHEGGNVPPSHKNITKSQEHRRKIGDAQIGAKNHTWGTHPVRTPVATERAIIAAYLAGMPSKEIYSTFNCSYVLLIGALKRNGVPRRKPVRPATIQRKPKPPKPYQSTMRAELANTILLDYSKGTSIPAIVARYKELTSRNSIYRLINANLENSR